MLPSVSCLCLAFGRTALLEESIECFHRQDYAGPMELIVLNDCARQTLVYEHPAVRVINMPERYTSLGEKRNAIAKLARHSLLCTWSDDDIHLPNRVSRLVRGLAQPPGTLVCREGPYYFWNGKACTLLGSSPNGPHIIDSDLYWRVGGIPPMNTGEDEAFNGLLNKATKVVHCAELPAGLIYRWATGYYHISGYGSDSPTRVSGWIRAEQAVHAAIAKGKEPEGIVQLRPQLKRDYRALLPPPTTADSTTRTTP